MKKTIALIAAGLMLASVTGCTNINQEVLDAIKAQAVDVATNATEIISGDSTPDSSVSEADQIDYSSIEWFGAPRPKSATVQDGVEIGNLVVAGGKLHYSWIKGNCEKLGATSWSDADHTQCMLAIKVNGTWKAGKFDWISTSRTFRELEHCATGYNNWPIAEFNAATEFGFVIVGVESGKNIPTGKRSNIIYYRR